MCTFKNCGPPFLYKKKIKNLLTKFSIAVVESSQSEFGACGGCVVAVVVVEGKLNGKWDDDTTGRPIKKRNRIRNHK